MAAENRAVPFTDHAHLHAVPETVILRASVVAGTGYRYAVAVEPVAGRSVTDDDLVRFVAHYYARVLYALAQGRTLRNLPDLVDALVESAHRWTTDVFPVVGLHGRVVEEVSDPVGSVVLELRRIGYREFALAGEIGLSGRTLAWSVFAVLQALSPRLSADAMARALAALANMNASYRMTHHYADPRSQSEVPAIAWAAVSFM